MATRTTISVVFLEEMGSENASRDKEFNRAKNIPKISSKNESIEHE